MKMAQASFKYCEDAEKMKMLKTRGIDLKKREKNVG
jgi:hypothetical protein